MINGYTARNQQELLQGMNLSVVPVLWEGNLPQVAIEQIAYGVPILVSDLGGAREIVNDHRFVFRAGDTEEFINKISDIMDDRQLLIDFWKADRHLVTMQEHVDSLMQIYGG